MLVKIPLLCYNHKNKISLTDGKWHDITFAKNPEMGLPELPPGSILTAHRGCIDYKWLYPLHCKETTFISPCEGTGIIWG
jgi:hypothetical protein